MSELEPTLTNSNLTATDRLRRLLDERGVEWEDMSIRPYACTSWRDPDGEPCTALEGADDIPDGKLSVQALLTPEQAIAATLGDADATGVRQGVAGTCRIKPWKVERDTGFFDCMECSECGYVTDVSEWARATYCAGCGRRIEQ